MTSTNLWFTKIKPIQFMAKNPQERILNMTTNYGHLWLSWWHYSAANNGWIHYIHHPQLAPPRWFWGRPPSHLSPPWRRTKPHPNLMPRNASNIQQKPRKKAPVLWGSVFSLFFRLRGRGIHMFNQIQSWQCHDLNMIPAKSVASPHGFTIWVPGNWARL